MNKIVFKAILGRKRQAAELANPADFPSSESEALGLYEFDIEKMAIDEKTTGFGFRSHKKKR